MLKNKVSKGSVDLGDRDINFTRRLNKLVQHSNSSRSLFWIKNEFSNVNGDSSKLLQSDACDSWYEDYSSIFMEDNVYAVWKVQPKLEVPTFTALDKPVLLEICKVKRRHYRSWKRTSCMRAVIKDIVQGLTPSSCY